MRKRFVVAMLAMSFSVCGFGFQSASATSPNIVLSQLQLGTSISASNEFIELYNNSAVDTEITNWCLYYASASSTQIGSKLGCFAPENDSLHLYVPSYSSAFAVSTALSVSQPGLGSDLTFSATLSGTAGHVRVIDYSNNEIDKIGWGTTAVSPETLFTATAPVGKVFQRKVTATPNILQDSDNNSLDFELVAPRSSYSYGAIYEVQDLCKNIVGIQEEPPTDYILDSEDNCVLPPVDVCTNIDDVQINLPSGYAFDDLGLCQQDSCSNLAGIQTVVPLGQELDGSGNCVDYDLCVNISGTQVVVPENYIVNDQDKCFLNLLPIKINELLPNAVGSDDGNEFIELYNPNDTTVDLGLYRLDVGVDTPQMYVFPLGLTIAPNGYVVFSDSDIGFTLVNTQGQVTLSTLDSQPIDGAPIYNDARDGMSWALIDTVWQYTNRPTPGAANLISIIEDEDVEEATAELKPCAPNQYRNLETNRCRLLVTAGSTLVACKDGQYRSEITNRCRNIAGDVLGACSANQERNPETNRCRLIASGEGTLKPCTENQERNLATNRCRNVGGSVPEVGFAVEPIADAGNGFFGWWALGLVVLIALGYGIWEWRDELLRLLRRLGTFFHFQK